MKFDFAAAFGKPCKLINDAAMQALGSYEGGRMLFIGLGTGLGSPWSSITLSSPWNSENSPTPPNAPSRTCSRREGRKRLGQKKWEDALEHIVVILQNAFVTDYIVIGGGNARRVEHLPKGTRLGDNRNAFIGGVRLWGLGPGRAERKERIVVLR